MYTLLISLSRHSKQLTLLSIDTILIIGALYSAFALRLGTIYPQAAVENALEGLIISDLSVLSPSKIELLTQLTGLECEVQTLPTFVEMIDGKGLLDSLKSVSADDVVSARNLIARWVEGYQKNKLAKHDVILLPTLGPRWPRYFRVEGL